MLVSHMSGLGDVTSSAARRRPRVVAGGTASTTAPARTNLSPSDQGRVDAAFNKLVYAQDFAAGKYNPNFFSSPSVDDAAAALKRTTTQVASKYGRGAYGISQSAARQALLTKAGAIIPGPGTTSPLALFLNKAATAATTSPAAAAAAAAVPAVTTTAPTITPTGSGGGGGGGDTSPTDTTDATTADAPTGWAALSPTMKVAIVGGGAVVAYIGYRAMRRR